MSDSQRPHGLQPTRLLRPWDLPGKSTGVGCHFLLQEIFPTQGSNPGLPHSRQTLKPLSHQGSLKRTRKDKGKNGGSERLLFGAAKSQQMVTAAMKLKLFSPWQKGYDQYRQHIKKRRHYFANKDPASQSYGFSSSHVWMWELDCKEI